MLYPAALSSALLTSATRALTYTPAAGETPASGARVELGELAEALLGAREPVYTGTKAISAARLIALEMNHLVGMGVVTDDVSALILQSQTRGARSMTNQQNIPLVPDDYARLWDALEDVVPPTGVLAAFDPARFLVVRSRR
jgi:hypothetical protein